MHVGSSRCSLLFNPEKSDEIEPHDMLDDTFSDYYYLGEKVDRILKVSGPRSLFLFHCNVRSLSKNLNVLGDITYSHIVKPDNLAITELEIKFN